VRSRRPALRASLLIAVAIAGLAPDKAATGTRPQLSHASAARFLLSTIEEKVDGDWNSAWQSLYPLHQRIAPREAFVRCETQTPFPAPLESLHVVGVRAAAVRVPGLRHTVEGVAITVTVALRWYGPRDPIVFRHTFHLVPVRGGWTWLLSPSRYRLYERGGCASPDVRLAAATRP
jgi:hypothetical protein